MAGGKGKKRSSSSVHEHDVGDDQTGRPKIRKLARKNTGKRKGGKLQIREHDKPTETQKGKKKKRPVPAAEKAAGAAAVAAPQMPTDMVSWFRYALEVDPESFRMPEFVASAFPGGLAQLRAYNDSLPAHCKRIKEHAAERLKEYESTGTIACRFLPTDGFRH
ncbi:hypothetical protein ACP70R_005406 [Stipagrostis hirtigluma subsp. patula]